MIVYNKKDFARKKYAERVECFCSHCAKSFTRKKRNLVRRFYDSENIFCSRECATLYRGNELREIVICEKCGKAFEKLAHEIKRTNHNFCSRSCAATWINRNREYTHAIYYCETCGVEIKRNRKYCSSSCSPYLVDYDTLTLGEWRDLYNTWQANAKIRAHSRQVYANSGKPYACAHCGYSTHVHIHHIRAVTEFPDETTLIECNNIDNLVALCPNHHWEADNGLISV